MPASGKYQSRIELLQGTLDMLILRVLKWGPQHGHGIGQHIRATSRDVLQVEHGSLYPALHRLEKQKLISSSWAVTENGRRARYYRLSASGRRQLTAETSKWGQLARAIAKIMKPA